jgi:hypothetical protein
MTAREGGEMPGWPDPSTFVLTTSDTHDIEKAYLCELARAEAALARLRVAVEHIHHAPRCAMMQPFGRMDCDCGYHEALSTIGPLPPETER